MSVPEPKISVVIATRDRPELLRRVHSQLLEQLRAGDELVVVDDAPSPSEVRNWLGDRVLYLNSKGNGPAVARNLGWRAGTGEIVAFTDDDVLVDANWLSEMRTAFASRSDLVGIEGRTVSRPFDPLYEYSVYADQAWNGLTCNVAYRRDALERLGGFDEAFRFAHCEDVDLFRRAKRLGSVEFAPNVVVDHEPRPVILAKFARRGGWLASERRLYAKHPDLKPYPIPPGICAVVVYLRWPVDLFARAASNPLRDMSRLRRSTLLTALWWWNVLKAVPALASTRA